MQQDGDIQQYSLRTWTSEKTEGGEMSLKDANIRTICSFTSLRISSNNSCRWCLSPEVMRKDTRAVAPNIKYTWRLSLPAHSSQKHLTAQWLHWETPNLKKVEKYGGRKCKINGFKF